MQIELKNFRFYDRLSEETYCFTANIWVNGTKCGSAENRGYGGETEYHNEGTEESKKLLKQAEEYCLKLPPIVWQSSVSGKDLDMNLTRYIDELVSALVKKTKQAWGNEDEPEVDVDDLPDFDKKVFRDAVGKRLKLKTP